MSTPKFSRSELAAAFEGASGRTRAHPPDRSTFERLLAAFPDEEKPHG